MFQSLGIELNRPLPRQGNLASTAETMQTYPVWEVTATMSPLHTSNEAVTGNR